MTKNEYLTKIRLANQWMDAYYNKDLPLASDEEYDRLIRQIKDFENLNPSLISKDSPTQKISIIQDEFSKIQHQARMWSMEDVFDEIELRAWAKRAKCDETTEFFIEPKFDGASLNLSYDKGVLVSGATRGDGSIGEDVSLNVRQIANIPQKIDYFDKIEIRGEVVILKKDFDILNEKRASSGLNLFANPRNAASGSLRQLNTQITKDRNLRFYPWGVGKNNLKFNKHSQIMAFIRSLGFLKDEFVGLCSNLEEVINAYKNLLNMRENKEMMIDGMVVRINDINQCEKLGYTVKFPKYMVAYKFPALEKTTKLININLQVGRTGVITPVAVLEPVDIDGVSVSFATLHNFDEINRLKLKINDYVSIIRSGDVIPKLTNVFINRRNGSELDITRPNFCPICNSKLLDEGTLIKCQNLNCKARLINSIIYFCSKKCLNIDGLGENIIILLFEKNIIKNIKDLFFLKYEDLKELEGFKEKKINNILNSIEKSKNTELYRFISALGIEHIGEVASKKIANSFGKAWIEKSNIDFNSLEGFGSQMSDSICEFIKINKDKILDFYNILNIKEPKLNNTNSSKISDKSFVITGTLSNTREYFKAIIENLGGKVSSSISKNSDYLLYGLNPGSKIQKAKELNIKCINEDEFNDLIKDL